MFEKFYVHEKFYVQEIVAVNLSKIYFPKNAKKTSKPNNRDLNRDWTNCFENKLDSWFGQRKKTEFNKSRNNIKKWKKESLVNVIAGSPEFIVAQTVLKQSCFKTW